MLIWQMVTGVCLTSSTVLVDLSSKTVVLVLNAKTTTLQPLYDPFSGVILQSQCQKRTSGLYGAMED